MQPIPGTVYRFTKNGPEPVNAGVALPVGSLVSHSHNGRLFVIVSDLVGREGQRAIERSEARSELELSRSTIEREAYRYRLLDERAPLPEVCQLIATRGEKILDAKRAREDAERLADDARRRGREILESKRPAWAQAAIVAELEHDASDVQTDYFATTTSRRVLLAWSKHTRDLFPELRKAAAKFPETAHLATPAKPRDGATHPADEHREKYSMGAGFYLKAGHRYDSGWKVHKTCYFGSLEIDLGKDPGAYLADQ